MRPLVVATRRSPLALAQSRAFIAALVARTPGLIVEELHVVTSGDRIQDRPLYEAGGKGLFVKEIEEALLERRADLAVHSMKDLPAKQVDSLSIACIPQRADPRDVLLVRPGTTASIEALPRAARVGSSSLRRRVALRRHREDLAIEPLRGNVDTRLRKLAGGEYDAIVLAAAGLARLGIEPSALPPHLALEITTMLPAVAQGILAIEAREGDDAVHALLQVMEHEPSRRMAIAERGVLEALDADCTIPLAAHARLGADSAGAGDTLHLDAWLAELDGTRFREASDVLVSHDPVEIMRWGRSVGERLKRG